MAPQPRTSPEVGGMGHSIKRKEDPRFLRGKGNYIDDVVLPNMLYMDIVRSPYAHAMITGIDASKALALPMMPTLMSDTQMVLPTDHVVYQSQEVAVVLAESRYAAADAIEAVE